MNTLDLINQLPALVLHLPNEAEFFAGGLSKFTMILSDEDDTSDKNEPDYGAILPTEYAKQWASNPIQMLVHYLHMMGHKRCAVFWKSCPVKMNSFTKSELDFIEECYIQRMFLAQSEQLHEEFYQCMVAFEEYRTWAHSEMRQQLNTMMYRDVGDLPETLKNLHHELYSCDPFNQQTFNKYINAWTHIIECGGRRLIELYDTVVAEK